MLEKDRGKYCHDTRGAEGKGRRGRSLMEWMEHQNMVLGQENRDASSPLSARDSSSTASATSFEYKAV